MSEYEKVLLINHMTDKALEKYPIGRHEKWFFEGVLHCIDMVLNFGDGYVKRMNGGS